MTTRRAFLTSGGAVLAGAALGPRLSFGAIETGSPQLPLPTPAQITWQDCEIRLLFCFDLAIAAGGDYPKNIFYRELCFSRLLADLRVHQIQTDNLCRTRTGTRNEGAASVAAKRASEPPWPASLDTERGTSSIMAVLVTYCWPASHTCCGFV